MGPGEGACLLDLEAAFRLGRLLAQEGWVVLSGGRDAGVMREVNRGAKTVPDSLTVGILPSAATPAAPGVDVAIVTEMHNARNNVNVLTSHVVIAFGDGGPGTASEIALALKAGKPVILLGADELSRRFFERLGEGKVLAVATPEEAVEAARAFRPA
jgi:uncharacterized protein (TIGR00725 family)